MFKKYQKYGLGWVDTALNIVNTGVNAYGTIKGGSNRGGGEGQTVNHTTVVERQLTPEEIKIEQEKHAEWLKNQQFNRAMQMQQQADVRRAITGNFGAKPQNDNTAIYIVGGLLALTMILVMFKKNR